MNIGVSSSIVIVLGMSSLAFASPSKMQALPKSPMPGKVALAYLLDCYGKGLSDRYPELSGFAARLKQVRGGPASASRLASLFYEGSSAKGARSAPSHNYGAWGKVRADQVVPWTTLRAALRQIASAPRAERFLRHPPYSPGYGLPARIAELVAPADPWVGLGAAFGPHPMSVEPLSAGLFDSLPSANSATGPVSIRFMGLHCLEEQIAGGADEPYVITTIFGTTGEAMVERSPFPQGNFEGVDDGNIRVGPFRDIWRGEPQDLNIGVAVWEKDDEDPEQTKRMISTAVDLAIVAFTAATGAPIPPQVSGLVTEAITFIADLGPDLVGIKWITASALEMEAYRTGPVFHLVKDGMDLRYHVYANVHGDGHYRVMYMVEPAAPPTRRKCSVRVHRVEMIDEPGDTPDYFAKMTIQGNSVKTKRYDDKKVVDPGVSWVHSYDAYGDKVDITIELFDYDSTSGDDRCDVSPATERRDLVISYDRSTGLITGDVRGRMGDIITVRGAGNNNRALLRFSVDFEDVPF